MNHHEYVDFFHASNSGFLKLTFVSLAKIFDRNSQAIGIGDLCKALESDGNNKLATAIENKINPHQDLVQRVLAIRNKSVSHMQKDLSRDEVYELYGVTPDEIRLLVNDIREVLNDVSHSFGSSTVISEGSRQESAVLSFLKILEHGKT